MPETLPGEEEQRKDAPAATTSSAKKEFPVGTSVDGACPPLSRALFESVAVEQTIMITIVNSAQKEFLWNWYTALKAAGLTYFVVGAIDREMSRELAAARVPCFDFVNEEVQKLGMAWGQEGWRRMSWERVFILAQIIDWGFNIIVSDVDVAWLRDPIPFMKAQPHADMLWSHDGVWTHNEAGDAGLEVDGNVHYNLNTGVYILRNDPKTAKWIHAWKDGFNTSTQHDQITAYETIRQGNTGMSHPSDPRVKAGFNGEVFVGIVPPQVFANGHSYMVSRLYEMKKTDPYVVHFTWTYGGLSGKQSRAREAMLWWDAPAYYEEGNFLTVDLTVPGMPDGFNSWTVNEDEIMFHLDSLQYQLEQAYAGMALASSAGRTIILPKFTCFCERIWHAVVNCRLPDAQAMHFPVTCPADYLFQMDRWATEGVGKPLAVREWSFLENPRTPKAVSSSVLHVQPSPSVAWPGCRSGGSVAGCSMEQGDAGGGKLVLVPMGLTDKELLAVLEPFKKYRVWRLRFGDAPPLRAYAGFACKADAEAFDQRMGEVAGEWCCRFPKDAQALGKPEKLRLTMTNNTRYSETATGAC